jgi:Rps23 Pro-64 3,4-dihydroxylase Tpa1-like proline 4-hydroxylase
METLDVSGYLLSSIHAASLELSPWRYAHLERAIPIDLAEDLISCFDRAPLSPCEKVRAGKSYRFSMATLTLDAPIPGALWPQALATFDGRAYRDALGSLAGVGLRDAPVSFHLWEYAENDWLSPHLDKAEKLVTQVIYLTQGWREGAGGRLLILERDELTSAVRRIPPLLGSATVLVRSDSSWHAVEPVVPGSPRRRSMTVTYWSNQP